MNNKQQQPANLIPTPESVAFSLAQGLIFAIASPEFQQGLDQLFAPSSLAVAQDAIKACEHGKLSHDAAIRVVAILLSEDQANKIKRAN